MDLSGGGGQALESQQAIGARVPYENIEANQKSLGLVMGSFFHAAAIADQQKKLEEALQATQLRLAEEGRWHNIEMNNMQQNAALRLYGMGLREQSMNDRMITAANALNARETWNNFKMDQANTAVKSSADLMNSFSNLDPGSPDFQKNYFAALASNSAGAGTPQGRLAAKQIGDQHNKTVSRQWDKYNADMREFGYEIGSTVWGDKNKTDPTPLLYPDMWKQQYVSTKDPSKTAGPEILNPDGSVPSGWRASDSKYMPIQQIDKTTGLPLKDTTGKPVLDFRTLPAVQLTNMAKRYQDLLNRKNTIPQQIVTDDVKPVTAGTASSPYPIAPTDPTQRATNTKYTSPTGRVATWTDQGWIPDATQ